MVKRTFTLVKYDLSKKKEWESFVSGGNTVLGTFLHTRNFLEYHPATRFIDHSLMVYDGYALIAVLPACEIVLDGKKVLFSHKGSTFGGPVVLKKRYTAEYVHEIIGNLEAYCKTAGFSAVYYKITPGIYSQYGTELLQYLFGYLGYKEYRELSTAVELGKYEDNILTNFEQGKRTNVNNCIKAGLYLKRLENDSEIEDFYSLLCQNLLKYDTKPVHTVAELLEFKNERLKETVEFYGVFNADAMLAGGMLFNFSESKMLHTQYLCADGNYDKLSPMTFLYYSLIKMAKERGFGGITWGTSTEDNGKILNFGLIRSKEAYGSTHYLNQTFYKELL